MEDETATNNLDTRTTTEEMASNPTAPAYSPMTPKLLERMRRVDPTIAKRYNQKSGQ
jgi:hypothetical protein